MINALKLNKELVAAGLNIVGVSCDGRIDWGKEPTASQLQTAEQVIANHSPVECSMTPETAILRGNGQHIVTLEIVADDYQAELYVNNEVITIPLDENHHGVLELLSDTPGNDIIVEGKNGELSNFKSTIFVI